MLVERDRIASGQSFCQLEIVAYWTDCFATEDKFLKPHIEKGSVLSDRYLSGVQVLADVPFSSTDTLCFDLKRSFFSNRWKGLLGAWIFKPVSICCRSKPTGEQQQATRRAGRSPGRWQALLPCQRTAILAHVAAC